MRTVLLKRQENKNEKTNERDEEIRRFIEERRNIVQSDKHQLKEVCKRKEGTETGRSFVQFTLLHGVPFQMALKDDVERL